MEASIDPGAELEGLRRSLAWERRARVLLQRVALAANLAPTIDAALAAAVERICLDTGWPIGHVYFVARDGTGDLVPSSIWHTADPARAETFRRVTERTRLARGSGLPGRIAGSGRPDWIVDVATDPNFPRAALAADLGVRAGFGLPVATGGEVFAVLEFFAYDPAPPDAPLLEVMETIGVQLGRVVERETSELLLRLSEERFRSVAQSATDAVVSIDASGEVVFWNRGAERMFGTKAAEAVGRPLAAAIPERYRAAHQAGLARLRAGMPARLLGSTVELHALRAGGDEFPIELSLASWTVGGETFYSGIIRDISERKRAEELLRRLEREAREASLAKSTFLANMSHELRTPLNGVVGMVDLLVGTPLDPRQRRWAEIAKSSANLLSGVISGILDFSKIEAGKLELESIDFVPSEVLADAVRLVARPAEEKGLALRCESAPELAAPVRGDPGRLRQVLVNLLFNAVKFTERGEVAAQGALERREPDGAAVLRFTIEDTGVGIARDRMERLFRPFSQGDASTTRRHGGSGLGLAISKQLAEALGGEVGAESQEGRGSRFWFTARFARAEGPPPAPPPAAAAPPVAARGNAAGRVLVVEDNDVNAELAVEILAKYGIACDVCTGGREALEALGRRAYALVLMDCHLPEMDGFETTRRIRQGEGGADPRVPVVAVTASATTGDRERCLLAGMNDYVVKPIDPLRLAAVVRSFVGGAGPAAQGPRPGGEPEPAPEPPVDRAALLRTCLGDEALARRLVEKLAARAPGAAANIAWAIDRGDAVAAREAAHSLKGAAANVSAPRLRALAAEAETAAREGSLGRARVAAGALAAEAARLKAFVEAGAPS